MIEAMRCAKSKTSWRLLIAVGTPMLLMGDEVRRTQHGNNNAYCRTTDQLALLSLSD